MTTALARLAAAFDRRGDKPNARPAALVAGMDDAIPWPNAAGLALQHVVIQSINFVLPALAAVAFGAGPAEAANYLCLSVLAVALFALLQAPTWGPLGSGYPCPAIPSHVMFAAYLLAAGTGASLADAAALTLLTGVVSLVVTPILPRLQVLLPTEVTGVVVFLTGASLLPVALDLLRLDPAAPGEAVAEAALAGGTFAMMALLAITRTRFAPYAVLLGAAAGSAVAFSIGGPLGTETALLDAAPWFAVPRPIMPRFDHLEPALMMAFALSVVAAKASLTGVLVAVQRAADGDWRRTDPGPLRRGLAGQAATFVLAGLFGGMAPSASSACAGVSIANRILARRIAVAGAVLLCLLALSPKIMAGFLLIPTPVKAAMLFQLAGFMMALGCGVIVTRLLDARRTLVVGIGLASGLAVLMAPAFFRAAIPALASPLALGAVVAVVANLVTLPLVSRRIGFELRLGQGFADAVADHCDQLGGIWGVRRETMTQVQHALIELGDLLLGRGLAMLHVSAVHSDDRLDVALRFGGAALPKPTRNPRAGLLDDDAAAFEAFSMALVLRGVAQWRQRRIDDGQELLLTFQD